MPLNVPYHPIIEGRHAGFWQAPEGDIHCSRVIDTLELIFVTSGVFGLREERSDFHVEAGQTLILYPGRTHVGILRYPKGMSLYWLHFRLEGAARQARQPSRLSIPQHAVVKQPDRMKEFFRRYIEDQASGNQDPVQAGLLVLMMLAEIQREDPFAGSNESALARRAKRYIHEYFHEPIHTHTIADVLNCNPDYLGRIYRESYGHSITAGINQRRIQAAKESLLFYSGHIETLAQDCGYASMAHFRSMFLRYTGMTPGAFRRLYSRGFR